MGRRLPPNEILRLFLPYGDFHLMKVVVRIEVDTDVHRMDVVRFATAFAGSGRPYRGGVFNWNVLFRSLLIVQGSTQGNVCSGAGAGGPAQCNDVTVVTVATASNGIALSRAAMEDDAGGQKSAPQVHTPVTLTWCAGRVFPFYSKLSNYKLLLVYMNYI